jgi:hypothetical protein
MGEPVNFEVCCGCTKFLFLEGRFLLRHGAREAAKKRRVKDAVKIQVKHDQQMRSALKRWK